MDDEWSCGGSHKLLAMEAINSYGSSLPSFLDVTTRQTTDRQTDRHQQSMHVWPLT